ncbi:MAG: hypothetical protein R2867_42165 [Caldilineaceae bacterium]
MVEALAGCKHRLASGAVWRHRIDLDTYKDDYAGDALLSADDEQTVTSLTGGGGNHLVYRVPDGEKFGGSARGCPRGSTFGHTAAM